MLEQVSSEQNKDNIDIVFKKLIENIKSYAVSLSNREERQVVASWVNKLCEPSLSSTSETERKNRNLYAQILLKMLQRTHLKKPFTEKPNAGKLPTIPVYMSSYLDETDHFNVTNDPEPKWLISKEFEDSMLLHSFNYDKLDDNIDFKERYMLRPEDSFISYPTKKDSKDFFQIPEANELEFYLRSQEKSVADVKYYNDDDKTRKKTPIIASETISKDIDAIVLYDDSLLQKFEDIANEYKHSSSKNQCSQDISKERALEKKLEFLERKIEVESTKIQQQQDTMVKNILDRKNNEMSDIKLFYQKKMAELEAVIDTRDRTISTLNTKFNELQERHDNEVSKFKDAVQGKESTVKNVKVYENKMNKKISNMEIEMKNLKRSHYENVERLVEENERNILNAKEGLMNENKILKVNITKLTENLKKSDQIKEVASKERDVCMAKEEEYQHQLKKIQAEVLEKNDEVKYLEMENLRLINEHENVLRNVNDMKNEASTTAMTIVDLQSKIDEYKCALENLESNKESEIKELKMINKEKSVEFESSMNKKLQIIQNDFDAKEEKFKTLLEEYLLDIKEKEKEVHDLNDQLAKQSKEAEKAIELLKYQAEEKSSNMFEELSDKLLQLQSSVTASKEKIKQQKADIVLRLDEQRKKYETKHSKFKTQMEEIHSKLQQKYDLDVTEYSEKLARQRLEFEEKLKGLLPLHIKIDLEDTIESMRQQIVLLQSQADLLQEELDTVATFNLSCKSNVYNHADTTQIFSE